MKPDQFFVDDRNSAVFEGIVHKTIRYIEDFQLLREDLWKRFAGQYTEEDADYEGGWRGEYWGKMMRGACFTYSYTKNAGLYRLLKETVIDVLNAQEEDGRISTYARRHEFEGWDMWCRKYVLLGMQYFLEICEDRDLSEKVITSMCRQVDYIMSAIGSGDGKIPIVKTSNRFRGVNSSSVLEPVVRLYSLTGDARYLEFAAHIVECGGSEISNLFELAYEDQFYPYQYPVTKAYEITSCFEGLLEYYRVTGIEKYKTAVVNYADRLLESDFTIIGGCGCTHEFFDHSAVRQANTTNGTTMQETCVTVTLMKLFYQLTLLTGDAKYSDAFELSWYNAYLGAVNTDKVVEPSIAQEHPELSPEPLPFDSYSPLTAGTRGNGIGGMRVMSDNHYYGCCASIGSVGSGMIFKMALLTTRTGFVLNLFIPGQMKTETKSGNSIVFRTVTEYPRSAEVTITLDTTRAETFELLIRNPGWSENTVLKINGEAQMVTSGYISIEREWKHGDRIELVPDMRTRVIRPIPYGHDILMNRYVKGADCMVPVYDLEDPMAERHIALRRGPIILARENRLEADIEEPAPIEVGEDGYVDAVLPEVEIAPYEHMIELEIPLKGGAKMHVTDYASAGKLWTAESKMAAWMLTK